MTSHSAMIDRAEQLLKGAGFSQCRVRYHKGDLTFSIIPRHARSGSGRVCVESIGTLN